MEINSEVKNVDKSEKKTQIRGIYQQYCVFVAGIFLIIGPYVSTLALQSSIAIQENIGTLALGIAYVVAILVTLFIAPFAIIRLGAQNVLMLGEMGYLVYIAANFYPKKWIKICAGIIVGAGGALFWPSVSVFLWHFGHSQGLVATRHFGVYVRKYTGIFFAIINIGQVLANAVAYGILHGSKYENQSFADTSLFSVDENSSLESVDKYRYCGANDCLENNNTEENLNRYVPANQTSLYVLIGVFCCSCVVGLSLQACKLESPKGSDGASTQEKDPLTKDSEPQKVQMHYLTTLRRTLKQLNNFQQILVLPVPFYYGFLFAIMNSEITRSLVSCVVGVEKVGMTLMLHGTCGGVISIFIPKMVEKIGRFGFMVIMAVIDIANYIFCLFWQPTEGLEFIVLILCVFYGISDGVWNNLSFDCYTTYFPNNKEIAYTIWNCMITLGLAVGFLWAPLFCVRTKLVIQIAFVTFSLACCGWAERRYRKKLKKRQAIVIDLKILTSSPEE